MTKEEFDERVEKEARRRIEVIKFEDAVNERMEGLEGLDAEYARKPKGLIPV